MTIGVIYGSSSGATAEAAKKIYKELVSLGLSVELHDIAKLETKSLEAFSHLFVGCSTWHIGDLQDDWADKVQQLSSLHLSGKYLALFGAGDQLIYSDTFQDAIGMLATEFLRVGATIVGHWPIDGYDFIASKAVVGNQFIGLALDDDNQAHLTTQRVKTWIAQVVSEMNLQPSLAAH